MKEVSPPNQVIEIVKLTAISFLMAVNHYFCTWFGEGDTFFHDTSDRNNILSIIYLHLIKYCFHSYKLSLDTIMKIKDMNENSEAFHIFNSHYASGSLDTSARFY